MKTKKTRIIITYIVLFTLLLGAILLSLYIGSVSIAPRQVFSVLTGHGTDAKAMQIILSIRLPRVLAAAILGGALRYLSQRYSMEDRKVAGALTDIGTEELGHLEIVL